MPTATAREEMISRIARLPELIQVTVSGLSDDQLDTPCGEGEWTIRQVVHHLADSHINSFIRLKLILTEEQPILKPYDQELWAALPDSTGLPLDVTFSILQGLHRRWTTLFESLSEEDWYRAGFHPEIGPVTPEALLAIYAGHGEEHVEQITRLLEANGWQ